MIVLYQKCQSVCIYNQYLLERVHKQRKIMMNAVIVNFWKIEKELEEAEMLDIAEIRVYRHIHCTCSKALRSESREESQNHWFVLYHCALLFADLHGFTSGWVL